MFDMGFTEMMLIAVVALVVIGPERLPKVARTIGHLFGRAQRYVSDVKSEINREMEIEELRKLQAEMQGAARKFESDVQTSMRQAESSVRQETTQVKAEFDSLDAQLDQAVAQEADLKARSAANPVSDTAKQDHGSTSDSELEAVPKPIPVAKPSHSGTAKQTGSGV